MEAIRDLDKEQLGLIALLSLGLGAIIFILWSNACVWEETIVEVKSLSWNRSIDIEHLNTYQGQGWSRPWREHRLHRWEWRLKAETEYYNTTESYTNSEGKRKTRTVRKSKTVHNLRAYYYYEYDQWDHVRYVQSMGSEHNPYWADYTLADKERVGSRSECYKLNMKDKQNRFHEKILPMAEWMKINPGYTFKAKLNFWGNILEMKE